MEVSGEESFFKSSYQKVFLLVILFLVNGGDANCCVPLPVAKRLGSSCTAFLASCLWYYYYYYVAQQSACSKTRWYYCTSRRGSHLVRLKVFSSFLRFSLLLLTYSKKYFWLTPSIGHSFIAEYLWWEWWRWLWEKIYMKWRALGFISLDYLPKTPW